jgi:hypothetical protein
VEFLQGIRVLPKHVPPTPQQEVELANNVLWLGNLLVVFQLKERSPGANTGEDAEKKWFQMKIINQATHPVRDTFRYLEEQRSIALTNHRGHERKLEFNSINQFHKLVVYLPGTALPQYRQTTKLATKWQRAIKV